MKKIIFCVLMLISGMMMFQGDNVFSETHDVKVKVVLKDENGKLLDDVPIQLYDASMVYRDFPVKSGESVEERWRRFTSAIEEQTLLFTDFIPASSIMVSKNGLIEFVINAKDGMYVLMQNGESSVAVHPVLFRFPTKETQMEFVPKVSEKTVSNPPPNMEEISKSPEKEREKAREILPDTLDGTVEKVKEVAKITAAKVMEVLPETGEQEVILISALGLCIVALGIVVKRKIG